MSAIETVILGAGQVGLVLVEPAAPTRTRFPEGIRDRQIHAYDSRETVLQTVGFLAAQRPAPDILEQVIEESLGRITRSQAGVPDLRSPAG